MSTIRLQILQSRSPQGKPAKPEKPTPKPEQARRFEYRHFRLVSAKQQNGSERRSKTCFKGIPSIQFPKDSGSPKNQLQMTQNRWIPSEITFSYWVIWFIRKSERNHHHYCKITVFIWIIMHFIFIIFRIFWNSKIGYRKSCIPGSRCLKIVRKLQKWSFQSE